MEIIIKTTRVYLKSGDRKSEVNDGKVLIDLDKRVLKYNGKTIELDRIEKEKSFHYLWFQALSNDGDVTLSGNMIEYKRKAKAKKSTGNLI